MAKPNYNLAKRQREQAKKKKKDEKQKRKAEAGTAAREPGAPDAGEKTEP